MKIFLASLLMFTVTHLFAFVEPQTIYSEDHYFITTGVVDFYESVSEVAITLLKYNDYSLWALNGMQGIDKESEGLMAYFTEIEYSASIGVFIVTFDLNLGWPFGSKGNVMKFNPYQVFNENGELQSITLIAQIQTSLIKEVQFTFFLENGSDAGASIRYAAKVKLSGFLDFFFSLKAYKKNFEWYILKLAENLRLYLDDR